MSNAIKKNYTKAVLKLYEIMALLENIKAIISKLEKKDDVVAYNKYIEGAREAFKSTHNLLGLLEAKKDEII